MKSDPICASSGCEESKAWRKYNDPKIPYPVDYAVPNFGADHDMAATEKHIGIAEQQLGVKWNPKQDEDGNWILPATPDIEFKLNQIKDEIHDGTSSDPICSSAGWCGKPWPKGWGGKKDEEDIVKYKTGQPLDPEIQSSLKNMDDQEKIHGKWVLPKEDVQLKASSDPNWNSHEGYKLGRDGDKEKAKKEIKYDEDPALDSEILES